MRMRPFVLAAKHPHYFAAIAPYSGHTDYRSTLNLSGVPVRMVTGKNDSTFPLTQMRWLLEDLENNGSDVALSIHEGVGHEPENELNDPAFMNGY